MKEKKIKAYKIDEFGIKNYNSYYVLILTLITLYLIMALAALGLLIVESNALTANISTYRDAFWTLQMSASTIGFGDHYPVTNAGRIIVMVMFYIGVGMMSFIGAQFINQFFGFSNTSVKNRELRQQNSEILAHNKELEVKLDTLIERIESQISKNKV